MLQRLCILQKANFNIAVNIVQCNPLCIGQHGIHAIVFLLVFTHASTADINAAAHRQGNKQQS